MIELLFVACLASTPDSCSERSMLFTSVTPQMCLMGAQPYLAKWVNTHPTYEIQSWKCRSVANSEKEA